MTIVTQSFQVGTQTVSIMRERRPKYLLELPNGESHKLCNAWQIRAVVSASGYDMPLRAIYSDIEQKPRGACKRRKYEGIRISKLDPTALLA